MFGNKRHTNWRTLKTHTSIIFIVASLTVENVPTKKKCNGNFNKKLFVFVLQQVNYKMHMNIRRMNDRKHHKRSKRGSSKVKSILLLYFIRIS